MFDATHYCVTMVKTKWQWTQGQNISNCVLTLKKNSFKNQSRLKFGLKVWN